MLKHKTQLRKWLAIAGVFGSLLSYQSALANTNKPTISVDIAPIHSLVAMVVGDLADVILLIPPVQSPHHFSLKPSHIRSLNKSDLIVILSEGFSPSLSRHVKALKPAGDAILVLTDSLPESAQNHINEHSHEEQSHDSKSAEERLAEDVHSWLNPLNAIEWIAGITEAVSTIDETNRVSYKTNAKRAIAELTIMHQDIDKQLTPVRDATYIVYHDAYRHFAHVYQLAEPLAIALSDARSPGAAKIKKIRQSAANVQCVFAESQYDDGIVDTVSAQLDLNRASLDPLGATITTGPTLYTELMRNMASSFSTCLSK